MKTSMKRALLALPFLFSSFALAQENIAPPQMFALPEEFLPEGNASDKVSSVEEVEDFVRAFMASGDVSETEEVKELLPEKPFHIKLRLINKRLGRVHDVSLKPDVPEHHKNIVMLGRNCAEDLSGEKGNNAAYVNVLDLSSGHSLFAGWLYKNTPSATGLSHPVYEVRLLECETL